MARHDATDSHHSKVETYLTKLLFVKILLVVTVLTSFVACDDEALAKKAEEGQRPLKANFQAKDLQKASNEEQTKVGKKWGDRISRPFFYGKKFDLKKEFGNKQATQEGKLVSPLITTPIRTLPLKSQPEANWNILQQTQNDILNSVRDTLSESKGGQFNKSYFAEDVNETENVGGEASADRGRTNKYDRKESLSSASRQDGDKSLMVVLPFKAESGNVEELFTKKPLVQVFDSSENLRKEVEKFKEGTEPSTTKFSRKQWRPFKVYRTTETPTTESTTTENNEEETKTYTNYNDVEQVTRKFEIYSKYSEEEEEEGEEKEEEENHNYEDDFIPQFKPSKLLRNKTPVREENEEEKEDEGLTTVAPTASLIEDLEFITEEKKDTSTFKPKRKGQKWKVTSTEGPPKPEDFGKVLEILPPEMKQIFEQMEINKNNKEPENLHKNVYNFKRLPQPTIDPKSYAKFRPLPLSRKEDNRNIISEEMKNLLESYGLLSTGTREQKSLSVKSPVTEPEAETESVEEISGENLGFLTDDLKSVLEDMGLLKSSGKKEPTRIHIFNPSNHTMAHTDEDRIKLNAILNSIKTTVNNTKPLTPESQVDIIEKIKELDGLRQKSRNLTEINNEIQKIVDENKFVRASKPKTTKRATKLLDGPDPVYFAEESLLKNDVKRQDTENVSSTESSPSSFTSNSTNNDTSTSSENESESSTASQDDSSEAEGVTTEDPNIIALRQSFGGGGVAPDGADVDSALPPKRPNGLYFLFDWNSFLEVGSEEDGARRVQLRFQPKVGDPRNFLTVTIP